MSGLKAGVPRQTAEERLAQMREYGRRNRYKWRVYNKTYVAKHAEATAAYQKAYYALNRDRILLRGRANYQRQRDEVIARTMAWQKEHRELTRGYSIQSEGRRRAQKAMAGGSHTQAEWLSKVILLGGCCVYCGRNDRPLTRDHKTPLCRGGSDDITNIVPACKSCNSRKRHRTASEYLAIRQTAA